MRIVVTGAGGFIGGKVVERLLHAGGLGEGFAPMTSLNLIDLGFRQGFDDPRVRLFEGSFVDAAVRDGALAGGVDCLFHLASVPGGAAQANYALGRSVNLDGSMALVDAVCDPNKPPIVVYSSSIAALGSDGTDKAVDEQTRLTPSNSYGCHKAMMEMHIADLTHRGWIDGRSLRPSGIVPRPREAYAGFATAWMSEIFRALKAGEPFTVPASPDGAIWLQSVSRVADNIIHAARMPAAGLPSHRAWTIPATVAPLKALVEAILDQTGRASEGKVVFAGEGWKQPPLATPDAERLGMRSDGGVADLVRNALADAG